MRRLLGFSAVLLVFAIIAVVVFAWRVDRFLDAPLAIGDGGEPLTISPGTSFSNVARSLGDSGIVEKPDWLRWYARITGDAERVQAGEYQLSPGTSARALLAQLVEGDVVMHSFTIVPGWTARELLAAMHRHGAIEQTLDYDDLSSLVTRFDSPSANPEGLFLPETYQFPLGTSDKDLLQQAHALLANVLDEEWTQRAGELPIDSPYDALTLASIIEKETALASERPRIAGVFVRRLQQGMRLQTDPTVIYGVGPTFDGDLTRRHMTTDTAYNTYTRAGLPPTPIALPGREAIHAALNPASGTELFFVATGLGDGSHKFSDNKAEHDVAVAEYLQRLRARRSSGN